MKRLILIGFLQLLLFGAVAQGFESGQLNQVDKQGRKQGVWKVLNEEGVLIFSGQYVDGKPVGTFKFFYPEGNIKATLTHSGDGSISYAKNYFQNGKLMAYGKYINQKKDSTWLFYAEEDGTLSAEEHYADTKKDGVWKTYYPEGQIAEETNYRDDKKEGPWTQYFTDGSIKMKATYIDDKLEGQYIVYHLNGQVEVSGMYKDAQKDGSWVFMKEDGQLEKREVYENGKLVSQEIIEGQPQPSPVQK